MVEQWTFFEEDTTGNLVLCRSGRRKRLLYLAGLTDVGATQMCRVALSETRTAAERLDVLLEQKGFDRPIVFLL